MSFVDAAIMPRDAALEALKRYRPKATSVIDFASQGRLLIIGPAAEAFAAAKRLTADLTCAVFVDGEAGHEAVPGVELIEHGHLEALQGYLGAFDVVFQPVAFGAEAKMRRFDLVLDLSSQPYLHAEVPPLGYFAPVDEASLEAALEALPELVGEFEKPRFFNYEEALCAHASRGISGCNNCIEACAAQAIRRVGERVEVDPHLCQGCGSCATSCPSGAMSYVYPSREDFLTGARHALKAFREAGGTAPRVLLYDDQHGAAVLEPWLERLPASVVPLLIEEIGAIGAESWLTLLAYGAAEVVLYAASGTPEHTIHALRDQLAWLDPVLQGLGLEAHRVRLLDSVAPEQVLDDSAWGDALPESATAAFAAMGGKRTVLRMAMEHLYQQALARPPEQVRLPATAPFGAVEVDAEACTLCMSCVSVCPVFALQGGGDQPQLWFHEDKCLQCGICVEACPEDAITLSPRYHFQAQLQPERRLMNEERMFGCVRCGKPFVTEKLMLRMEQKLSAHWMYQSEDARERLRMCEDCRVRSLLAQEGGVELHEPPGAG